MYGFRATYLTRPQQCSVPQSTKHETKHNDPDDDDENSENGAEDFDRV